MAEKKQVSEENSVRMTIVEDDVNYEVVVTYPSDDLTKASMVVFHATERQTNIPLSVLKCALNTLTETKTEFAEL